MVQGILVAFYLAVARSMQIPIGFAELAVIVPVSFIVQMIPLSVNGFGVARRPFGFYFTASGVTARILRSWSRSSGRRSSCCFH
jgi:hypothetical protein